MKGSRSRRAVTKPPEIKLPPATIVKRTERLLRPVLGNYITHNRGLVQHLKSVREQIDAYIRKPFPKRPLNILLAAPPGSGKSFLIKQLIESLDYEARGIEVSFEECYVPALETTADLYSIFQRVQSLNLEGRLPVVFFDEIDAEIAGGKLFAKFLAPMWDGTFYVGKDKHFLGRSIFFFAGSTLSCEDASEIIVTTHRGKSPLPYNSYFDQWKNKFDEEIRKEDYKNTKITDFVDRIDQIVRIPPMKEQLLGDNLDREYQDVACMLILKHFPKVRDVGELALQAICDVLIQGGSTRTAEKIIFSSQPTKDDTVFDILCLPKKHQFISKPALFADGSEKSVLRIVLRKQSKKQRSVNIAVGETSSKAGLVSG